MKHPSKLTLSAEELRLVNDSAWILTKHAIIDKLYEMFGQLSEEFRRVIAAAALPETVAGTSPKISKGENYRKLPYVILDYPRCFDQENMFAIRTMFWWGNFFSISILLSGVYKEMLELHLQENYEAFKQLGFYLCTGEDPWQHHFEEDNYLPLERFSKVEFEETVTQRSFVKLALRYSLAEWNEMPVLLLAGFTTIVQLLNDQLPRR